MAEFDIFISYRRVGGFETAKHLYDLLRHDMMGMQLVSILTHCGRVNLTLPSLVELKCVKILF